MNVHTFRNDLRVALASSGMSQSELSRRSGVEQYNISKFLNGEREMLLSNALRLWPFVYGDAGPCPTESLSAESGEGERGDGDET